MFTLCMWKLSAKLRVTVNLGFTEIMYLQDKFGGEVPGYPGLDRCPSCLSNVQPPQDTGHGPKTCIILERGRASVLHLKIKYFFHIDSAALL